MNPLYEELKKDINTFVTAYELHEGRMRQGGGLIISDCWKRVANFQSERPMARNSPDIDNFYNSKVFELMSAGAQKAISERHHVLEGIKMAPLISKSWDLHQKEQISLPSLPTPMKARSYGMPKLVQIEK
jgi:hypothetical protein